METVLRSISKAMTSTKRVADILKSEIVSKALSSLMLIQKSSEASIA